jgi:hypothetical protein
MKYLKLLDGRIEFFLMSLFTFFAPIKGLIITIGALVILDTLFGIYKSCFKLKQPFTSRKFSAFITKTLIYQVAVLTSFTLDYHLLNELTSQFVSVQFLSTKLLALSVCFTEVKSLEENFKAITNIDLWKNLKELIGRAKEVKTEIEEL